MTYVFEVDAVEMPELESQVVPEDEPTVSISASMAEALDDEVLPFEARPAVTVGVANPAASKETEKAIVKDSQAGRDAVSQVFARAAAPSRSGIAECSR